MIVNKKLVVVLLVLIIINITPATAFSLGEIQKEGDYVNRYTNESGWYKFCHFLQFCKSIFNICQLAISSEMELEDFSNQAEKQKIEMENRDVEIQNKKSSLEILSNYHKMDRYTVNASKTNKTSKFHKPTNIVSNHTKSNKNSSSTNITDDTSLNNDTDNQNSNNTDNVTNAQNELINNADHVKDDLKQSNINVNVSHNVKVADIENKSIVQLLNNDGYIKYGVFLGKVVSDGELYIKLFNGKEVKLVLFHKFTKDFTGITLNFISSNNVNVETECDVAEKIYDDKLSFLNSKIELQNKGLVIANCIKGIGIGISILVVVLTILASILLAAPEPALTKAAAIKCYIIAAIVVIIATAIFGTGLIIETVLMDYKNGYIAEKEDLESYLL